MRTAGPHQPPDEDRRDYDLRMRVRPYRIGVPLALSLLLAAGTVLPQSKDYDFAFERDLYRTRYRQELQFREAVIHVAWAAEALCASTTQIEPFVLLSTHALRRSLAAHDLGLLREVTQLDEHWRVVWSDESVPDELRLGDVVTAINGRTLPGGATRFDLSALFVGGSVFAADDQGFWEVMDAARKEAQGTQRMRLTLGDGRAVDVETQTGCAGAVTASGFDADPDTFARLGSQRVKIPANAVIAARSRDEFRWLAAFGTYFQASQTAIEQMQRVEGMSTGFAVGRILTLALPGAGLLLTAVEAQNERRLAVDGITARADLFANEVVAALGGDPGAGLALTERMLERGMKVDVVMMDALRRSNSAEHARRIRAIQAAQAEAERQQQLRDDAQAGREPTARRAP